MRYDEDQDDVGKMNQKYYLPNMFDQIKHNVIDVLSKVDPHDSQSPIS